MRTIFLRSLGAVYVVAFGSLAVQVEGLIGRNGILPVQDYLDVMGPALGLSPILDAPDIALVGRLRRLPAFPLLGGVAVGALLIGGVLPVTLARFCSGSVITCRF